MAKGLWSLRVDGLSDIYSETRVMDMLRTVDEVTVERVNDQDGSVHVDVEVPSRTVGRLIREMVRLIDARAKVSRAKPRVLPAL